MERKINDQFQINGKKLKVKKSNGTCQGCFFNHHDGEKWACEKEEVFNEIGIECVDIYRTDGIDIIYAEEK